MPSVPLDYLRERVAIDREDSDMEDEYEDDTTQGQRVFVFIQVLKERVALI